MGVLIYLMQPRKARRIFRHKVPNLCEPGQKFDSFSHQTPTFFSKVSNTLKLLQQPALPKANNTHNYTQTAFRLIRKQTMTLRMKQLSKPKMKERSMSLPQKTNQFSASKKEDKYQSQNPSQLRYSVGEVRKLPERIKKNKVDEIVGSGLAALPLQKILAQRQEYLRVKQKTINLESEEDEQGLIHQKKDTNDELKPDREDFMKWLQKIIGNQGNLYEQYEKGLMEKVNLYERKKNKYKLQFEGSWK